MNELENALRGLEIEWPATPDLATAVATRIAAEKGGATSAAAPGGGKAAAPRDAAPRDAAPRARAPWWRPAAHAGWRARLAYVAAALVLVAGGTLAASPEARSTVLRWLGIKSVEIKREPPRPTIGRELDLGRPIALPRGARVPAALGTPDTVYATTLPDGTEALSLVYAGPPKVLVQSFRASATPFIEKSVVSADAVERLKIDGHLAYWITGAHGFAFQAKDSVGYEQQRLSDRVLLLERDGVLLRVEGAITRDRAVEIAKSAF